MGESAEGRSFLLDFALGVAWRVDAEASRFLIVSRFSLCSRAGAFGLARAAASGLGLSGDETAGALSPSSGRRIGGTSVGVLEREGGCDSAILRVDVAGVESATAACSSVGRHEPGHASCGARQTPPKFIPFSNFYYSLPPTLKNVCNTTTTLLNLQKKTLRLF